MHPPSYVAIHRSGELHRRAEEARARLERCDICAHGCGVNRLVSADGANCRTGERALVSSAGPHFGEEDPLVGTGGSGTIFFAWCNLRCVYCQNADISQQGRGQEVTAEELAALMLDLRRRGCHNINLVSPSHVVPQFLEALCLAAEQGLDLPIVYNTGGYDSIETLRLLDGVVDIYMPDMKYASGKYAETYSGAADYPEVNRVAVLEMHRQVGDLELDERGVAVRGLLVRHLVLPDGHAGTAEVVRFLAEKISENTYINVMAQYRPCYKAGAFPPLDRSPSSAEFTAAVEMAKRAGLRLDRREPKAFWFLQ
jgi:putative pyruvate formate lyase activating enzyme